MENISNNSKDKINNFENWNYFMNKIQTMENSIILNNSKINSIINSINLNANSINTLRNNLYENRSSMINLLESISNLFSNIQSHIDNKINELGIKKLKDIVSKNQESLLKKINNINNYIDINNNNYLKRFSKIDDKGDENNNLLTEILSLLKKND